MAVRLVVSKGPLSGMVLSLEEGIIGLSEEMQSKVILLLKTLD